MIQNTETSLYQQAGLSFYPYESMIRMNIQFHRFNHIFRFQDRIQVFFGKNVMFQHQLIHSFTRFQSLLRYLCRMFIANYGIQCGHYSDTVVYIPTAFFFIGCDAINTYAMYQNRSSTNPQIQNSIVP